MAASASGRTVPAHPSILEIDTWPWLAALTESGDGPVDLGRVPAKVWDAIAETGYDLVWLMGVWQRSPVGVAVALQDAELLESIRAALPDFVEADVVGSPYCIRDYAVDDHLGGRDGLAAARSELSSRGVGLVLDFVPNHVAPDHPWVSRFPERFVLGDEADLQEEPSGFVELGTRVLAHGRDPYFPAWPDVVQLNAFSFQLRAGVVETLRDIADQCDGVRCDMAMLMMDDVFAQTWGARVGPPLSRPYWPEVIESVRHTHPGFVFVAEAYWDREFALQQQGFDYCYDKRLYDRLVSSEPAPAVVAHLSADPAYQSGLMRFVENHDEPRAATVLDPGRQRVVAITTLTQAGARLVHDGQTVGRRTRLPVFLGRFPDEVDDAELETFYDSLLGALSDRTFHDGTWQLCRTSGWEGNDTAEQIACWCWTGDTRWLVVVNLGDRRATARVAAPWPELEGSGVLLHDPTQDVSYERTGSDLDGGLYVELPGWGYHLFRAEAHEPEEPPADGKATQTRDEAP